MITDRTAYDPMALALRLAAALRALHPDQWQLDKVDKLLCDAPTLAALQAGKPVPDIRALWQEDLTAFRKRREAYLMYKIKK